MIPQHIYDGIADGDIVHVKLIDPGMPRASEMPKENHGARFRGLITHKTIKLLSADDIRDVTI